MAPLKQPSSLLKAALKLFGLMIIKTCRALEEKYGNWDTEDCKAAIYHLQQFLLSQFPGKYLYMIYNECLSSPLLKDIDPRIHIAVFMHKGSKDIQISQVYYYKSKLRDFSFWETILHHSNNIIYLSLYNICSDEILQIVGNNCLCLNNIDISTPNAPDAVSDVGLLYLENCINLKVIIINEPMRSCTAPIRRVKGTGVSHLLKCLPNLQVFTFKNMGSVIAEVINEVESLALTQIHFNQPRVSHIIGVSNLCSNLQELCLQFSNYFPNFGSSQHDICDAIRTSPLHVNVLKLFDFTVNESLFKLLSAKGKFLSSFTLHANEITLRLVKEIGKSCPDISYLNLCRETKHSWMDISEQISLDQNVEMFCKLENLTLTKLTFMNLNAVVPIVLSHAQQVKKLSFELLREEYNADEMINDILRINPMTELNELYADCILSMRTISYFFYCPQMTKLSFLKHPAITSDEIHTLEHEILKGNLDITIHSIVKK